MKHVWFLRLTLALVAVVTIAWPLGAAQAKQSNALQKLAPSQRNRIGKTKPFEVSTQAIPRDDFAVKLDKLCKNVTPWTKGTRVDNSSLAAVTASISHLENRLITNPIKALLENTDETNLAAVESAGEELSKTWRDMQAMCKRIVVGNLQGDDVKLLRKVYRRDAVRAQLSYHIDLYTAASTLLEDLLDGPAPATATAFMEAVEPASKGRVAGAGGTAFIASMAQTAFDGLAEFLIDRAKEEAINYLREQLFDLICDENNDPVLFIPETCRVLETVDASMSLSAIGTMLHGAVMADLELLPDRVLVAAWKQRGAEIVAYPGTVVRALMPLARDPSLRGDPIEYVAAIHSAPALDCETLAAPTGHTSGDERCADTMAFLRMGSMVIYSTSSQRSPTATQPRFPFMTLALAFQSEVRFVEMPQEAKNRIVVWLPAGLKAGSRLEFNATYLQTFTGIAAQATVLVPRLTKMHEHLKSAVEAGTSLRELGPVMLDMALGAGVDLTTLSKEVLTLNPPPPPSPGGSKPWMTELEEGLDLAPKVVGLTRAYANQDWGTAGVETMSLTLEFIKNKNVGREFSKRIEAIQKYLPLFIEIANAESSDEVNMALQTAFPAGGYKRKYRQMAVSLNGFLGIYGGGLLSRRFNDANEVVQDQLGGEFAAFAPVGVHWTVPMHKKAKRPSSFGVLGTIIDLGGITTSKWIEQEQNPQDTEDVRSELDEPATINLAGLVSPGGYFTFGLASSPFTVGLGLSYNPFAQKLIREEIDANGVVLATDEQYLGALRFGAFLAVDITFVSFGLRTNPRK